MSIEKSPAAVNHHKATARADNQGGKAKSSEVEQQGAGFMAILGALGDAPVAVAADALSPDSATIQPGTSDSVTAQNPALDAATLLQQNPQIAAAQGQMQLAANATAAATASAVATANIATAAAAATTISTANSATATAPNATAATLLPFPASSTSTSPSTVIATAPAVAGASTDTLTLPPQSGPDASQPSLPVDVSQPLETTAKRSVVAPGQGTVGDSGAAAAVQAALPTIGESATQGLQHAASHVKSGKETQLTAPDTAVSNSSAATASSEKAEAMKWMAAFEQSKLPQAGKAMELVFAPLLVRAEKSAAERVASAFKSADPGYSGTALGVSAPDTSQSGAAAPITAPEMQVAEQVTYWVTQNVQNAELKLEGMGQSPVEVSISVQGKEAQITFRTDEAATRSVLEGASAHLKDLLQREGMVLTGVSVGTSGRGDSSGAERRARQAARQGAIAPLQVATVTAQEVSRRVSPGAGRSVDLFV